MTSGTNTKLTDDQRYKLFAHYFRIEMAAEVKRRAAAEEKSANRKHAKAADPTLTGQKFDHFLKAHFSGNDQKAVDRLLSDMENLVWTGAIATGKTGDLFAQKDRVDREVAIRTKGFNAGLLDLDRVSGYDGGSADDRLWLDSYDAGKREFKTDIPDILAIIEARNAVPPPADDDEDPFE